MKRSNTTRADYKQIDSLLERKIANRLYNILRGNALSIADFILSLKTEINPSNNHIKNNIMMLTSLSHFHKNIKSFKEMTREDVLAFLDGVHKSESVDPLHKWIGSYNTYRTLLVKFFKWLNYPNFGLPKRSKRIAKRIGRSDTTLRKLEELHDAASNNPSLYDDLWQKVNSNIRYTDKMHKIYKRRLYREQILKDCQQAQLIKSDNIKLIHGDFIKVSKEIPDDSVDLIFTDPPYDKKSLPLYKELALLANRVLKPGGSIVCYCGTYAIPQILDFMKEAKLTYYWINAVILQWSFAKAWKKHITIKWKPLLCHIKGRNIFDTTEYMSDVIKSTKPDKLLFKWQQSTNEPDHVISRLTVQNQTVLDPMMGSGTTGIAALNLKRRFIGIELEEETFRLAYTRINRWLASKENQQNKTHARRESGRMMPNTGFFDSKNR